ncbi:MAG: polyphosphate kinase 1 [Ignavibacteriaceae bacterium]
MKNGIYNRELSWLSFNYRVLQEAKDTAVPLYERIKFLAIYSSNLDEFFRVRVASLRSLLDLKKRTRKKLNFSPEELLLNIQKTVHKQQEEFGAIFREQIIPLLRENSIHIVNDDEILPEHHNFVQEYFRASLFPFIQPVLIEQKNISLFLKNRSIYLAVRFQKAGGSIKRKRTRCALIEIPVGDCGRFIALPDINDQKYFMFLDDLLRAGLKQVFPGYEIVESYSVKLTRDAELYIDDEFSGDLRDKIKKSLSKRTTGVPCRFLYDQRMPKDFLTYLRKALGLKKDDLLPGGRYHNFHDLFSFPNPGLAELEYEPMKPLYCKAMDESNSLFELISKKDILLHYPYQSYDYVLTFLTQAANDPAVKSIKISLYRTAKNSKVIKALIDAAKNGKSVTAFVEVKARFDEELNFQHAEEMEKAGIKVLYSFPGLKVHSKICLVKRDEKSGSKYFAYLATGNFNEKTALIYSDFGFFTANDDITNEVNRVFSILSKPAKPERLSPGDKFNHLMVAPFNLRESFVQLMDNEINAAKEGKKAYVILKLNSIEDKKMIKKLYEASNAGVKIQIIVRGICCLVPGIKNLSSNIKVISILDRFLEHSRVYIFCNGGDEKIFVSSADWMRRNLNRRIELCFPVYDDNIKKILRDLINIQLKDNVKARVINIKQTNPYRKSTAKKKIRAQYASYNYLNIQSVEKMSELSDQNEQELTLMQFNG